MESVKQTVHRWNKTLQLTFLILIFLTYTFAFWLTVYNGLNLIFKVDTDYILLTLKSGALLVGSLLGFLGCLFTTTLFDTLEDVIDTDINETK